MAILSSDMIEFLLFELREEPKEKRLAITPILDKESQLPYNESSIDLRLGTDFLTVNKETGPTILSPANPAALDEQQGKYHKRTFVPFGKPFNLHPQEFALARTLEYISLPDNMAAYVIGRSSLGRLGLVIATATMVHSGFQGTITLELSNLGTVPMVLYPGMRIAQLAIHVSDWEKILTPRQKNEFKKFYRRKKNRKEEEKEDQRYQTQYRTGISEIYKDKDLQYLIPLRHEFALGVVGKKFSGKSTLIRYLTEECGFKYYSISDIVRRFAVERGIHVQDGEMLKKLGDAQRRDNAPNHWAWLLVREMRSDAEKPDFPRNIVIDGIKNAAEVKYLRKDKNFHLISITADFKDRLKWAQKAGRIAEGEKGRKELRAIDARDSRKGEVGQQVARCIKMVSKENRLENKLGTCQKELEEKFDKLIETLKKPT